jgi:hypothetical protein
MSQSKLSSAVEAVANVMVGYWLNVIANLLILPLFGWDLTMGDSMTLGVIYTFISLGRSYGLRRLFNRLPR